MKRILIAILALAFAFGAAPASADPGDPGTTPCPAC